jgi:hypothetical protein
MLLLRRLNAIMQGTDRCLNVDTQYYYLLWLCSPARAMASFTRFLDHTQRRATVGRTPLDE